MTWFYCHTHTHAHRDHLVLADLHVDGYHRTFYDDQHISVLHSSDPAFAFECPPYRGDNPEAFSQSNPSGSKELILILVVNKSGQTHFGRWYVGRQGDRDVWLYEREGGRERERERQRKRGWGSKSVL